MQSVIVYIIVIVAFAGSVYFAYKRLKAFRGKRNDTSACSGCPLKESCNKVGNSRDKCNDK